MTSSSSLGDTRPDRGARVLSPAGYPRVGPRAGHWWARFFGWAILLSAPCWLLADVYHRGLRAVAALVLGVRLPPPGSGEIEVHATQVLGIFAAMCLASMRAPLRRRLRAVLLGVPALMVIELLAGIVAIEAGVLAQRGSGLPGPLLAFLGEALAAPPWLAAPVLWILLLGAHQLPQGLVPRGLGRTEPGAVAR
jgi:hypothetical protein